MNPDCNPPDSMPSDLPWVAMRLDPSFGPGRYPYCCACEKWIQGPYHGDETQKNTWATAHAKSMARYDDDPEFRAYVHQSVKENMARRIPAECMTVSKACPPQPPSERLRKRTRSASPPCRIDGAEENYIAEMKKLKLANDDLRSAAKDSDETKKLYEDCKAENAELKTRLQDEEEKAKRDFREEQFQALVNEVASLKVKCEKKDKAKLRAVEKAREKVTAEIKHDFKAEKEQLESKLHDAISENIALKEKNKEDLNSWVARHREMEDALTKEQKKMAENDVQHKTNWAAVRTVAAACIKAKSEMNIKMKLLEKNAIEEKVEASKREITDDALRVAIKHDYFLLDALNGAWEKSIERQLKLVLRAQGPARQESVTRHIYDYQPPEHIGFRTQARTRVSPLQTRKRPPVRRQQFVPTVLSEETPRLVEPRPFITDPSPSFVLDPTSGSSFAVDELNAIE